MAALNPEIIKDTKSLVYFYQKNPRFKTAFDRIVANNINATYKGRPVKLYVEVLKNVTSKYKQEYSEVRKIVLHDKEGKVGELFNKVNPNTDFPLLDQAYEAAKKGQNYTNFEKEEIDEINDIEGDAKNNNKEKRESYKKREERIKIQEQEPGKNPENKKSYNPASQEERDRLKVALLPKDEIPRNAFISPAGKVLIKPTGVQKEIPINVLIGPSGEPIRNIYPEEKEPEIKIETEPIIYQTPPEIQREPSGYSQPPTSLPNIPTSRLRNFASGSKKLFSGGAKASGVVVKGAGRAVGAAIKAGAGTAAKLGASVLAGAATGGIGLVVGIAASMPNETKKLFKLIFWIIIGLIAFIVVMFVFQRGMKMNSLLPPYDVPTMDSANGDIASCNFYRASEPASYKSNLLLSYISEASNLTGIPPTVLAAFIRVESPASVGKNDDQIRSYTASCVANEPGYVSETGALGIMQIQPPGTKSLKGDAASCEECIDAGAKLLGKTVQSMTVPNDYCDPRTNIIVGSGWILKKMQSLGYKNSGKWDPAWTNDQSAINTLVFSYYGALKYTDGNGKEQDYGNDVWTSIQNCHPSTPLPTIKPGDYCGKGANSQSVSSKATATISDSQLQSEILQQFNIKMDEKFTPTNLRWAYEKFADISDTNFLNLATKNGPVIVQRDDSGSEQESPNLVRLKGFTDEAFFKTILLHELGHIIYNYRSEGSNQRTPHDNLYFSLNQGVTAYGTSTKGLTCYGAKRPESENYPEMLTYYLNPRVTELTYMNNCPSWGKLPYGDVFTTGRNKEYYSLAYKILCQ